jgi:hypothetical protein
VGPELALFFLAIPTALGVVLWLAARKGNMAPLEPNPPRERPKKVYAWGDQVLLAAAERHGLKHSLDIAKGLVGDLRIVLEASPHAAAPRNELSFPGEARFRRPLGLELELVGLRALQAGERVEISEELDMTFRVKALHPDQAKKLLAGDVGEALLYAARKGWAPRLDDRGLSFEVPGRASEETLAEAFAWLVDTARAILSARAVLPRPELEQRVLEAFAREADVRGGRVDQSSGELQLSLDAGEIRAFAQHSRDEGWRTTLSVELRHPIGAELHLGLEAERSAIQRWRKKDVQVGDAAFDAALVIAGESDEAVRELLGASARKALLALVSGVHHFELEPTELTSARNEAVHDAKALHEWVDATLAVVDALTPQTQRSAYR